jgi:hypothetical protein
MRMNNITFSHFTGRTRKGYRDFAMIITVPQNFLLVVPVIIGYYMKREIWDVGTATGEV